MGQFNVSPVLDFDRNQSFDVPVGNKPPNQSPSIQVDRKFNPFDEKQKESSWEPLYKGLQNIDLPNRDNEKIFDNNAIESDLPCFQLQKNTSSQKDLKV